MNSYTVLSRKSHFIPMLTSSNFKLLQAVELNRHPEVKLLCIGYLLIPMLLIFLSCERKLTEAQFEGKVFNDIFLALVDSTYKDKRIYMSPPEVDESVYDKSGRIIERDTVGLVIAIGNGGMLNDSTDLSQYYSQKFIFKHLSELPDSQDFDNWSARYPKFAGVLSFSRIKFDRDSASGSLDVSYRCGMKRGLGYLVTITKTGNKWVISNIKDTWIS